LIELVSGERCIGCDVCIRVCPTNVFERGPGGIPEIARQDDCQTCFMCEAWCPADALFVAPQTTPVAADSLYRDEQELIRRNLLESYRRQLGWDTGRPVDPGPETEGAYAREPLPVPALEDPL
jgi:NAD-dependent dihydropyrimidine dehydrogenase PreA subunit